MKASDFEIRKERLYDLASRGFLERDYAKYLMMITQIEIKLTNCIHSARKEGKLDEALGRINELIDNHEHVNLFYYGIVQDKRLVKDVGALYEARLKMAKDKLWQTVPAEAAA